MPLLAAPFVPLHLGALHPVEQALVYLLAFGPFVVLGIVVAVRRRQDRLHDKHHVRPQDPHQDQPPGRRQDDPADQRER